MDRSLTITMTQKRRHKLTEEINEYNDNIAKRHINYLKTVKESDI
ncbi:unnamed protein product [marine sediment metagenome]|uniref:Uncharacterized protein n=1 Tax=marine sediment metagenome TaxID=412755 RepID=X1JJF8_9ZZZZ